MQQEQTNTIQEQANRAPKLVVKQNNTLVIILSVLLLISVLISGFFAYQTQNLVKELNELKTTIPSLTTTSTPSEEPIAIDSSETDPTADWKTYTNKEYSFSFKYPVDWKVTQSPLIGDKFNLVADKVNNTGETGFVPVQFSVNMSTSDNKITTLAQAENAYRISSIQTRKEILVGGRPAVTVTGLVEGPGPGTGAFLSYTFIKLDSEVLVVQLGNKDYQQTFDQILSTFKFTN